MRGDERMDGSFLRWFGHIERMETDSIAIKVCVGSRSGNRTRNRWIDSVNDCLKKRGLRMGYDRNEWREFVRGNAWGLAQGMNP